MPREVGGGTGRLASSRVQHPHRPPSGWIPLEQLSFMQAVRSPAPELDPVRDKPIAGPEWRAGHLPTLEPSLDIEYTLLQLGVARKGLALQRSPRADLASP